MKGGALIEYTLHPFPIVFFFYFPGGEDIILACNILLLHSSSLGSVSLFLASKGSLGSVRDPKPRVLFGSRYNYKSLVWFALQL